MSDENKFKDEVLQNIQELTSTMKEHIKAGDTATIDVKNLAVELEEMLEQQVKDKLEEAEKNRPVRKGEIIGPPGFAEESLGVVESGKFIGQKMSDVLFAGKFLQRAAELSPKDVKPLSEDMQKLLTATGSGTGDEFVPTGMAGELWNDFFLASRIVPTIGVVPMPTDPFDFPVGWGSITWRKGSAGEAAAAQDPATAKSTMTATEQIAEVNWNYDLDEDAIIAVLPTLRSELARHTRYRCLLPVQRTGRDSSLLPG
jgi:HK97 family phage major capsid protein